MSGVPVAPHLTNRYDAEVDTVVALSIEEGRISGLYAVRNPDKLSRVSRETALSR